jgi:SAM-dependent methyltransferase
MDALLNIMRALGDPTRLRIALLIRQLELSVGEVVQILGQSQPRVSRHIRILDEAGIAERRKEGSWVFLRPGDQLTSGRLDALFAMNDGSETRMVQRDLAKLAEVRAGRASMAAAYFKQYAGQWDQLRSLHIAESEVEASMRVILGLPQPASTNPDSTDIVSVNRADFNLGRVLDIGTGTGRMIELFADYAEKFTAIDNNAEMLRVARAKLPGSPLPAQAGGRGNVEIMLGDFNALPLPDTSYDTVLFHQVLHYAQAPERVIAEAARVLAPGGCMLIADFAAHDHEELRSVHAHARLGFRDEMIARAFDGCGMKLAHRETLDGGALTVKIWLGRKSGAKQSDMKQMAPLAQGQAAAGSQRILQ